MFDKVLSLIPDQKTRDVVSMAGGMVALLGGRKVVGLGMFGRGAYALEQHWRAAHPEFQGNLADRWNKAIEFYESTHKDDTNRKLHIVGIPMIVGGAAGLLIFSPYRPAWFVSAGTFTAGWVLNFIGHGIFEKNAPAFADDPLSFIAGPVWDFQQIFGKGKKAKGSKNGTSIETMHTPDGPVHVINVDPAEPAMA